MLRRNAVFEAPNKVLDLGRTDVSRAEFEGSDISEGSLRRRQPLASCAGVAFEQIKRAPE